MVREIQHFFALQAVRSTGNLHFGLYHSLFEWFNEEWLADHKSGFKSRTYALNKALPELYDIVNRYKPEVIWYANILLVSISFFSIRWFLVGKLLFCYKINFL